MSPAPSETPPTPAGAECVVKPLAMSAQLSAPVREHRVVSERACIERTCAHIHTHTILYRQKRTHGAPSPRELPRRWRPGQSDHRHRHQEAQDLLLHALARVWPPRELLAACWWPGPRRAPQKTGACVRQRADRIQNRARRGEAACVATVAWP